MRDKHDFISTAVGGDACTL